MEPVGCPILELGESTKVSKIPEKWRLFCETVHGLSDAIWKAPERPFH
jgi:hypothetical protein